MHTICVRVCMLCACVHVCMLCACVLACVCVLLPLLLVFKRRIGQSGCRMAVTTGRVVLRYSTTTLGERFVMTSGAYKMAMLSAGC